MLASLTSLQKARNAARLLQNLLPYRKNFGTVQHFLHSIRTFYTLRVHLVKTIRLAILNFLTGSSDRDNKTKPAQRCSSASGNNGRVSVPAHTAVPRAAFPKTVIPKDRRDTGQPAEG